MDASWWNRRIEAAGLASLGLRAHELDLGAGKCVHWWESAPPTRDATTFVFLPGNGCSSLDVGPLGAALAKRGRLVGLEPPGREPTLWPDEPFDFVRDLPPIVDQMLDAAGVGDCILVGHSMGAMLALHVARQRPKHVRGLVMIEGFVSLKIHNEVVSPQGFRAARMPEALRAGWERRMAEDKAWLAARPRFAESFWESQKSQHDARAWVAELGLPILIFVGDLGQPMPPVEDVDAWRRHVGMDRVRDFEVCVVPNAGHWAMLDDAPAVIGVVDRWLGRVGG
ncbi:MAG: alpha/beta fold hydrolase [Planctomycetota bacterium]|nr:alpha/beta fold hydrolase [Planctomycetota bacterium]